jgi:biotin---protein ligase
MVYKDNGGRMIFSQIHLEVDPSLYENDESKYQTLLNSDGLRHEIFSDVLNSHLGLEVKENRTEGKIQYSRGFFLGRHEVRNLNEL